MQRNRGKQQYGKDKRSLSLKMSKEYFLQGCAQSSTKNGKDLTEAEEIKKRWQEYTEELCKKSLLLSQ